METMDVDFEFHHSGLPDRRRVGRGSGDRSPGSRPRIGDTGRSVAEAARAGDRASPGFELTREQAYLHAILDLILRHTEDGRAIYGPRGERLVAGDRLVMSDLADTLELLADGGPRAFYAELSREAVSDYVRAGAATSPAKTSLGYRPIWRRPVRADFVEHQVELQSAAVLRRRADRLRPPPARPRRARRSHRGSAEAISRLVEVMREQTRVRGGAASGATSIAGGLALARL